MCVLVGLIAALPRLLFRLGLGAVLRHLRRHLHYVAQVTQAGYAVEYLVDVDVLVPRSAGGHLIVLAPLSLPLIVGLPPPVLLVLALPLLLLPLTLTLLHLFFLRLLLLLDPPCLSLLPAQLVLQSLNFVLALLVKLLLEGFPLCLVFELRQLLVQQLEVRAEVLNLIFLGAFDIDGVVLVDANEVDLVDAWVVLLPGAKAASIVARRILPCHLWADTLAVALAALLHPVVGAPLLTSFLRLERPGVLLALAQSRVGQLVLACLPLLLLVLVRLIALIVLNHVFLAGVVVALEDLDGIGILLIFILLLGDLVLRLARNVDAA